MRSIFAMLFAWALALSAPAALAQSAKTVMLAVQNMTCSGCAIAVKTALKRVDGVIDAKMDMGANTATVTFDASETTPEALTRATGAVGFPSTLKD